MQHSDFTRGMVWLVGAGPGDPDLLTRKAEGLLNRADIVFYDALVGPGVLALIPPQVEQVSVGKRSGRHSKAQSTIEGLLVAAALEGKCVVRLKGGDPSMFARSAEEMTALTRAGITFRVCPGVTAASAAAASARISLSLRDVAHRVQFVTAHARQGRRLDIDWAALADEQSTLAFYMGREAAGEISARLLAAGRDPATPVLIASDVSLPAERLLSTRLDLLPLATAALADTAPTLILIGEVTSSSSRGTAQSIERGLWNVGHLAAADHS